MVKASIRPPTDARESKTERSEQIAILSETGEGRHGAKGPENLALALAWEYPTPKIALTATRLNASASGTSLTVFFERKRRFSRQCSKIENGHLDTG
jgi:hypothetical protein